MDPTGTDYEVNIDGGTPFWFESAFNEFAALKAFAAGYRLEGGMWGGTIYNAAGDRVGSYTYAEKIARLSSDIADRTEAVVEAVGLAATATQFALAVTNPIASSIVNCAVGSCSSAGGLAMAVSPRAARILGGLGSLAPKTVAHVIRLRGGGGSQVQKVATHLQNLPLGEVAELAARGDEAAKSAIEVAKEAKRLHQKY